MTSGDTDEQIGDGKTAPRLPVVGVGASAGGVNALRQFLSALPADTGAAFVVVVHLDPQGHSDLAAILSGDSPMPVTQIAAAQRLEANHVYVIPPDRWLQLSDREIATRPFDAPRGQRAPIDLFFRSLAQKQGDAIAVILTGAGSDGAVGVGAVKEAGGIVLVQDPAEAEYSSMPRSAVASGAADFILPLRSLAAKVSELLRRLGPGSIDDPASFGEEMVRRILAHVRVRTGHDFNKYKRSTLIRRLARRMQVTHAESLKAYYEILRDSGDEVDALLRDLLISVTSFFRDSEVFEALRKLVLPELFADGRADAPVRVWVPGCASGEEAYTIAILLLEEAARHEPRVPIQVFGSDLDVRALSIAREGRYPAAIEGDVSEDRLRRHFVREGDHYRVRRELRDVVLFANHNLLRDPPFSRLDLVSCRNLLIYLDRELQQQVCATFHYALNPNGFLLLGSSEIADNPPGMFRCLDRKARIYQSAAQASDKPRLLPPLLGSAGLHDLAVRSGKPAAGAGRNEAGQQHRLAIERLAPPSVLVDESHRVLHLSESAGRYLQPSGGPLSGDIVELARPELRFELRSGLHRAFEQGQPTLTLPILVQFNGSQHPVQVQTRLATHSDGDATTRQALVLFIEGAPFERLDADAKLAFNGDSTVKRLTEELQLTQALLRTTRAEAESANEELRAANEELQSINEEYRSTSEELETSKEELQSINEELQTVNSELKLKLDAVSRAHSDLQNLMAATDLGILFLDSGLRIKRFTEQVRALFPVTSSDEGRPITDFASLLEYQDLVVDAQTVLANLAPINREVRSRAGRWYDIRFRPYRTVDDKIDGVVITFVDVTARLQAEESLRRNEQELLQKQTLFNLSHDPFMIWELDGGVVEWNRGSEELYGIARADALGQNKFRLLSTSVPGASLDALRATLMQTGKWSGELRQRNRNGKRLVVESRIVLETIGGRQLVLESTRDITARKRWERRQQLLLGELTHRVKNILSVVQAIAHQSLRSGQGGPEFVRRFDGRLTALGVAHNLLVNSNWEGVDLGSVVRSQLEPYAGTERQPPRISGPALVLPPDVATSFALVLHELATNAVKYGALSAAGGNVEVEWTVAPGAQPGERRLTFRWTERGGPPVIRPAAEGFGSSLIDNTIAEAKVVRDFRPEGLVCTIEVDLPPPEEGDSADDHD